MNFKLLECVFPRSYFSFSLGKTPKILNNIA